MTTSLLTYLRAKYYEQIRQTSSQTGKELTALDNLVNLLFMWMITATTTNAVGRVAQTV